MSLVFFWMFYSCENHKKNENTSKSIDTIKVITENVSGYDRFENEVFKCIDDISNSNQSNRKDLLRKFISYSEKVDGAVAEGYCYFAYNYPLENTNDFFSVLQIQDTLLIKDWVLISGSEMILEFENVENSKDFYDNFEFQIKKLSKKLNSKEQYLMDYYHKKLIETIKP